MPYHACPVAAALAVVAVGWGAMAHDERQPPPAFGYRVTGSYPVVVLAQPAWGAAVLGTVTPGSVVASFDEDAAPPPGDFRHITEPDGDGWVLAADVIPEVLSGQADGTDFEPTFRTDGA